jgi:tetratricopeptide (TPR) repeat protein
LDNLQLVFPAVFDSELVYVQGRVLTVDRAHNWFLDTWVTLGLPGLLSWLSIYAVIGLLVWRRLRDSNKPDPLLAGVIAGIVAGFTNNLVSFDIPPNATATVLLLGTGIALCRQPADVKQVLIPRRKRLWLASSALFLVLALAAAYQWGWKPLQADMAMRRALLEAEAGNGAEAVAAALHAISLNPNELHYKYVLAEIYYLYSQPGLAQESIERALAAQPENILYWLAAARHYSDRESTWPLAARAYRQAAELGPELAVVYAQWGRFYLAQEDADHAAPLLRRAAALDGSNAVTYFDLSAAERMLGRIEDADAYLEEAQRLQAHE